MAERGLSDGFSVLGFLDVNGNTAAHLALLHERQDALARSGTHLFVEGVVWQRERSKLDMSRMKMAFFAEQESSPGICDLKHQLSSMAQTDKWQSTRQHIKELTARQQMQVSDFKISEKIGGIGTSLSSIGRQVFGAASGGKLSTHGACAAVYKASMQGMPGGEFLALKVAINSGPENSPYLDTAFAQEHFVLEHPDRLPHHENIVQVFHSFNGDASLIPGWNQEYGSSGGKASWAPSARTRIIVMPHLEYDLKHMVKSQSTLPQATVIICAVQLLRAVAHLKQHRLVHRDLKPDNVMLTGPPNSPHLVVVDFGFVLDCEDLDDDFTKEYNVSDAGFTKGGAYYYLCPEVKKARFVLD
jgi:serine/threonine protein kinase